MARLKPRQSQVRKVEFLPTNLEFTPEYIDDIILGDNLNMTLTQIMGQAESGGKAIQATELGQLITSSGGNAYTDYSVYSGGVNNTAITVFSDFGNKIYKKFDIYISGNDGYIEFPKQYPYGISAPGTRQIFIPEGWTSLEFTWDSLKIRAADSSANINYQIAVWY